MARKFKQAGLAALCLTLAAYPYAASADTTLVDYPSHWRMQDALDGAINIFYTGSPCPNGQVFLSGSASVDIRDRLWSLLLTAGSTNKMVGLIINSGYQITGFYSIEN